MGTTADKLNYLDQTKTAIKDAIITKGVSVPDNTTFREYANKIEEISGGGGGSPIDTLVEYAKQNGQLISVEYESTFTANVDLRDEIIMVVINHDLNKLIGTFTSKRTTDEVFNLIYSVEDTVSGFQFVLDSVNKKLKVIDSIGMAPMYVYDIYIVSNVTFS